MKTFLPIVVALGLVVCASTPVRNQVTVRTLAVETAEFSTPDVTASPDGQSIVFTVLGHLFRVPTGGGAATQLTFGPSYDSDPVFSPDGGRIAFVSDRDSSGGNIFVLDTATRQLTQLTREVQAESPVWSPDGSTIAYVRVRPREESAPETAPGFSDVGPREVRTVPSRGGSPAVIGTPAAVGSLFYMPDGRLGWTVPERAAGGGMFVMTRQTRVEVRGADGAVTVLANVPGDAGRVVSGPAGDGLVYAAGGGLRLLPFAGGAPANLTTLGPGAGRFAIVRGAPAVFFAGRTQIFRVASPGAAPEALKITVSAKLEAKPAVEPKWTPSTRSALVPQAVVGPQLSPDGTRVVFMAAGFLWEQSLAGSAPARRLFDGRAFERDPAFSPDGRKLAFITSEAGKRELKVYDFATRQTRALYSVGAASWPLFPNWKPDGSAIVVQKTDLINAPYRLVAVTLGDGKVEELGQTRGDWTARPHFSADGHSLYYTARPGRNGILYRVALEPNAKPEALTQLTRHVHEGLVSPDGKWFALRRNSEIWVAPMAGRPIQDADLRRFSTEGGRSFNFTADSSAIVYSGGGKIWRQSLQKSDRAEIPVRLTLPRAVAPATLVRRVRIADVQTGTVGAETSMLIQDGRIRWIGAERNVPAGVAILDAGGRIAIPGLFDLHVHSAWANQQASEDALVAFGITSIRDTGSTLDTLGALDDRSETTALPVPRYFFSGEIFEGEMPAWGDAFLTIATEAEAREHVRRWKAYGVDFIKIYPTLPWHLQHAVADEARKVGLPVVGHGLGTEEIIRRAIDGYASIEHSPGSMNGDVIKLLAATGTRWDATLDIWGGHTLIMRDEPARLTDPRVRTFVAEESIKEAPTGGLTGRQPTDSLRPSWKDRLVQVKAARESGVRMRAGTDSLMSGTLFGVSLHWELEHFVESGMTPAEALRLATVDAAESVGASDSLGTLAEGKFADLVLLDANPFDNIRNAEKIWRVLKGGHVFDPATFRGVK